MGAANMKVPKIIYLLFGTDGVKKQKPGQPKVKKIRGCNTFPGLLAFLSLYIK
jgi:hypothetical protein